MKKSELTLAQKQVLDFAGYPYNEEYIFFYRGSVNEAKRFIQRMRTELSRMRRIIKDRKQIIIPFKMIEQEISEVKVTFKDKDKNKLAEPGDTKVVLIRTLPQDDATEEIQDIFGSLMTDKSRKNVGLS